MKDSASECGSPRAAGRPKDMEKRDAILNAAASLFLEHGFDRTSMDAIANAAGVSKLTVYSHFNDKDGLFKELIRCKCQEYFEERDFTQLAGLPPAEALARLGSGFIGLVLHPDVLALYRLLMSNAVKDPVRNRTFYETGPAPTIASLAQLLAHYNEQGLLKVDEPELAADHFLAMLQGCMHLRALLNVEPSPSMGERSNYLKDAVAVFMRAYATSDKPKSSRAGAADRRAVRKRTGRVKKVRR